jgi:hypothetical protein
MRFPQLVVCAFDDWASNQLRDLAAEHRWVIRDARRPDAVAGMLAESRPTVLVVQVDPAADKFGPLELVADVHHRHPDAAVVVLSDAKLSEDARAAWTAAVLDLGARYVLFPPLTKPVLEDLVSGLMATVVRRAGRTADVPPHGPAAIDLADEGHEDD